MFSAFTPSPMAQWLTAMPVSSPRAAAARSALTSFICTWLTRLDEALEERNRILPGDERVPRIHIHAQVGRIHERQHLAHEFRIRGVVPVRLDVDDDVVRFGDAAPPARRSGACGPSLRGRSCLSAGTGRPSCRPWAPGEFRPADRMQDVFDPERCTFRPRQRKRRVDL